MLSIAFGPGPGTVAYRALRIAGYIWTGVTPELEMIQDCFDEANSMLDGWGAQQNMQPFIDDRYFAINTSQQSYTLGPTGDFSTDVDGNALLYRPQRIIRANLVLLNNTSNPTRIPIEIIPVSDYADIPVISIPSQVTIRMYVQTTFDNVTLWCFPFPTTGNQFEFFMWPGNAQIPTVTAVTDNNPGFIDALVYGLAERMYMLSPKDKGGIAARIRPAYLHRMAVSTKMVFEGSNAPTPELVPDLITSIGGDGQGAPFNYLDGDYSQ